MPKNKEVSMDVEVNKPPAHPLPNSAKASSRKRPSESDMVRYSTVYAVKKTL